ncbi:hypothetical protein OBBRIDRAFT_792544 [Obba rivulosa]|uniref:Ricin B lectin domain-containing protein n=1 Tax=Obba rivulosa TaxID=1052685 RepID=A0A8E2AZK8_9APHY|nr:hypothetical protein OBBRIDRAFT_792544 [Obba rivulosa]
MSSQVLAAGTYFIFGGTTGTALEFADDTPGRNLTAWQYTGDANQQWNISGGSNSLLVQNVMTKQYISFSSTPSGPQYVTADSQPFDWFVEEINGTFFFSPNPTFTSSWNVDGGFIADNTPVIVFHGLTPFLVNLTSSLGVTEPGSSPTSGSPSPSVSVVAMPAPTANNQSTSGSGGGSHVGAIVGGVVGGVGGLALIGGLLWLAKKKGWLCFGGRETMSEKKPTGPTVF